MNTFLLAALYVLLTFLSPSETQEGSIVYFSSDNGKTWDDRSTGLPRGINVTDLAIVDNDLAIATKQHGIFTFNMGTSRWTLLSENPAVSGELDALHFYKGKLFAGANTGVLVSSDRGRTWKELNTGLANRTIRKFTTIDNRLLVGTNGGLFILSEAGGNWVHEFGNDLLQVNGIKEWKGDIYIGTNQGAFKMSKRQRSWEQLMADQALYNIGADEKDLYALTYSELLVSSDNGKTWRSDQKGLPEGKYSFQILGKEKGSFIAQWDGVYKKELSGSWALSGTGLPEKFPVTELIVYGNVIVASSSGWAGKR